MLPIWYSDYKEFVEEGIQHTLDMYFENTWETDQWPLQDFEEAIRYSVQWWKKIRAILALEFYLLLSHKKLSDITVEDDIIKVCTALEMTHSWTLIQDDLPCMDNDTLRRWQPTVWSKYGEYQAVLASDVLHTYSYELLSSLKDSRQALNLIQTLSKALGYYWVASGQIEDLYYEEHPDKLNQEILLQIHRKKTGKLIKAAVKMWIIASWNTKYLKPLSAFGEKLWLAFQIKDDILDVEGSIEETGKSVWRWEEKGFVFFQWLEKSKKHLRNLLDSCLVISKDLQSEKLSFITEYVWNRVK